MACDEEGPDLSCFDFGEEEEEAPMPTPAVFKPKGKGKGKAAQRAAKKAEEEAQREVRIAQAKAEPAGSVRCRQPGEPAALGEFVDWALTQQELAGCPGPENLLQALQALARGGDRWDERRRLEDLLLRFEQVEADYSNPVLAPRYRWRAVKTALEKHGHVESLQPSPRQQARPCALLLGDSHFERLDRSPSASAALPRGAAVHAVGGDGAEHLLMRLHLTWRGCLAHAHAQAYVVLVGINNLLGNIGETSRVGPPGPRRSKRAEPAQIAAGLQRIVDLLRAASGVSSVTSQPAPVYVCHCLHVLGAEATEDSKWGALLPDEINPRVDELNALIDQLRDCVVVPLRVPREPSLFTDGLHLSDTGYRTLLGQLVAHVPPLATSAR